MVRPITTHDVDAVSLLLQGAIQGGGHTSADALKAASNLRHWVGLCWDRDADILGSITGQCVLDEAEIHELAVREDARRQGIASAIVHAFVDEVRRRDARVCWLEVRASNAGAIEFYDRLGFEAAGRRPRYYSDGESAVVLRRDLSA